VLIAAIRQGNTERLKPGGSIGGRIASFARMTSQGRMSQKALAAFNSSGNGGGGAQPPVVFRPETLDLGWHGIGGRGVGGYGTGGRAEASVRANGTLHLVKSLQGLSILEFHYPNFDIYFNAGAEFAGRAEDCHPVTGKVAGCGSAGPGGFAVRWPTAQRLQGS